MVMTRHQKGQELTKLYTALLIQASAATTMYNTYFHLKDPTLLDMVMGDLTVTVKRLQDIIHDHK